MRTRAHKNACAGARRGRGGRISRRVPPAADGGDAALAGGVGHALRRARRRGADGGQLSAARGPAQRAGERDRCAARVRGARAHLPPAQPLPRGTRCVCAVLCAPVSSFAFLCLCLCFSLCISLWTFDATAAEMPHSRTLFASYSSVRLIGRLLRMMLMPFLLLRCLRRTRVPLSSISTLTIDCVLIFAKSFALIPRRLPAGRQLRSEKIPDHHNDSHCALVRAFVRRAIFPNIGSLDSLNVGAARSCPLRAARKLFAARCA